MEFHHVDAHEFGHSNHLVSPKSDDSNNPHHENFHANIEMPHEDADKHMTMAERHRMTQEEIEMQRQEGNRANQI